MKEPFGHGSIRRAGTRWLLDAYGSMSGSRAHLVLHPVRPGQAYVRQDLALLWRSAREVRLVWGLEPFRTPKQTHTPDDSIWRGISARLGARRSACTPRVRRTGLGRGALTYAQPTLRLAARCRGATLAVHHPDGKIGGTAWIFGQTFTGLATSNMGGVGFLEQTIPDT